MSNVTSDPPLPGLDSRVFRSPRGGSLSTSDPQLQAALTVLGEHFPRSVSHESLFRQVEATSRDKAADRLPAMLWNCYAEGMVALSTVASPAARADGQGQQNPLTTALVRQQSRLGKPVTNLLHIQVPINEVERHLLQHLDGRHSREQLAQILSDLVTQGQLPEVQQYVGADFHQLVESFLQRSADLFLLQDSEARPGG